MTKFQIGIIIVLIIILIITVAYANGLVDPVIEDLVAKACEDETLTLKCSPNKKIIGGKIKYGRYDNTTCLHDTVNANTPLVSKEYDLPTEMLNKEIAEIAGGTYNNVLKEDPLPNVRKQAEAKYQCQ